MHLSQEIVSNRSPVARLYELYAPAIFAYLRRHTSSREDAEDVLVEVFVAAVEAGNLANLGEKEQLAWLWRVARNKGVDAYRREKLRQGIDLDLFADMIFDDDPAPEQAALLQEEYAHLRMHLEKLTPLQREALHLRFANDLRCSEIAEVLGKREGAIRVLLSRTLNFLRAIYAKDQGEASYEARS
ncbi:MAG: RNA polymerase sigma factor [Chloroflexota bacterium]|nr:RNA polymerase sigma factor [Chloroflexota bacterium]